MRLGRTAALAAGVLIAAGCSSTSTADATAAYCDALGELRTEVESFSELAASNGTIDELEDQQQQVSAAWEDVVNAGEDLDAAASAEASDAADAFQDELSEIPGDATLSEAAASYRLAAEDYLNEIQSVWSDLSCDDEVQA